MTEMQTGEVLRREVFNLLDAAKGGRLKKLKEVNKHEIVEGVTEDYMERTGKLSNEKLVEIIRENFDLRPAGIIKMLDLRRPIYKQTAAYGHFGRNDLDLPWEKLDKVEALKKYL